MTADAPLMAGTKHKPLMRSLGEFFGHIIKGVKTDPDRGKRTVVRRQVEEEDRGDLVLRRTTIEEIEIKARAGEETDQTSENQDHG
jgi:hypothetical protein